MSQASVKFSIALILACVFIVIAPGLAAEPEFPPLIKVDFDLRVLSAELLKVRDSSGDVGEARWVDGNVGEARWVSDELLKILSFPGFDSFSTFLASVCYFFRK
ncbi:hypothetical protein Q3G72_028724 [Acer saccharum]|nr:hypothetical protein Q3G72_028724 [Acer saccharum]